MLVVLSNVVFSYELGSAVLVESLMVIYDKLGTCFSEKSLENGLILRVIVSIFFLPKVMIEGLLVTL